MTVFTDPETEPDAGAIHDALGEAAPAWDRLLEVVDDLGAIASWRYYRDGGWLVRVMRGSQIIAWVSVEKDLIRMSVYFAERLRGALLEDTGLVAVLQDEIARAPSQGKMFAVSLEVKAVADVSLARAALELKLAAKNTKKTKNTKNTSP